MTTDVLTLVADALIPFVFLGFAVGLLTAITN